MNGVSTEIISMYLIYSNLQSHIQVDSNWFLFLLLKELQTLTIIIVTTNFLLFIYLGSINNLTNNLSINKQIKVVNIG